MFSRIKAGKFHFVLFPDHDRMLGKDQFVVIGAGQGKGKVALQRVCFASSAKHAKQVRF
jgi:hypothetical protein